MHILTVHTDGGARGNPGPSAIGVVFQVGEWQEKFGLCIGIATNNVAEYRALRTAIERLPALLEEKKEIEKVEFYLDSELVVKQVQGLYKVKEPNLQILHGAIKQLLQELPVPYTISHVLRVKNAIADSLVNQALDAQALK